MNQSNPLLPGNRITFIDSARGIAACLVLFQHTYEHFFPEVGKLLGGTYINFGQVGVVVFFLVSGFIIPWSLEKSKSVGHFFTNRIFRIYPLYLFIILLQFVLIATHLRIESEDFSYLRILITHVFFVQEYIPESNPWSLNLVMGSWTLFIEAIWYVLFACLFVMKIKHNRVMTIAIAGFALLVIASYVLEKRFPMGRMGMLFNCILGLHFYRWYKKEISESLFYIGAGLSVVVIFGGLWLAYGHFFSEHFTPLCVLASWSVAYLLFGLLFALRQQEFPTADRILSFLGTISYSVYLAHHSVMLVYLYFFDLSAWVWVLTVLSTIVFSYFSYTYIEKPGIDFGKSLWKKNNK